MLSDKFTRTTAIALFASLLATVTLFTAISALAAETTQATAPSACHAQLTAIHTDFPPALQARGEHGDVTLKVSIGKEGRAIDVQTAHSSGYRSLDEAAAVSVSQNWRFDVSRCAPGELPLDAIATVKFARAPQYTVSGTINRHRSRLATGAPTADRCDLTHNDSGDTIVACLADSSLLAKNKEPKNRTQSLADRIDTQTNGQANGKQRE
jgi:TonB family protein